MIVASAVNRRVKTQLEIMSVVVIVWLEEHKQKYINFETNKE